ncbi:MAG: hypothetical protein QME60_02985 [Verrucomicrobiota bacterium]|nr:hypothetical protein [Verrucomicrobiota bacterium]
MLLPHLSKMRHCARVLSLENLAELSQGHADAVASNIVVTFRLAGSPRNEPILIPSLLRVAVVSLAVADTQRAFTRARLSNDRLRELSQAAAAEMDLVNMKRLFMSERAGAISIFESMNKGPRDFVDGMCGMDAFSQEFVRLPNWLVYGACAWMGRTMEGLS